MNAETKANQTSSFADLTNNKDIEQIDAAIEFMLLEIADLNLPSDAIARRLFEYGFELARPEDRTDATQVTTWMAIIDGNYERSARLLKEFDQAFVTDSTH